MQNEIVEISELEQAIRETHKNTSNRDTPRPHIKHYNGMDYVDEAYMRNELNKYYPIWSWVPTDNPVQFLGSEWVIVNGMLRVNDNGAVREFFSPGASRIHFKREGEHTPENVVDIDNNIAAANTNGFKRACNRLCNIADDIYQKRVEDFSLDVTQLEEMEGVISELEEEEQRQIRDLVEKGSINSKNFGKAMNKLKENANGSI